MDCARCFRLDWDVWRNEHSGEKNCCEESDLPGPRGEEGFKLLDAPPKPEHGENEEGDGHVKPETVEQVSARPPPLVQLQVFPYLPAR
jgi:hypothetical protein